MPREASGSATEIGARGRICTCTREGLSFVPLRWATWAFPSAECNLLYAGIVHSALCSLHCPLENGAPGQNCTDTVRGLNPPPLHWATGAACALCATARQGYCWLAEPWLAKRRLVPREGVPPQPLRSERSASGSWANAAKLALPAGLSPASSTFEASRSGN